MELKQIHFNNFILNKQSSVNVELTYQTFGLPLGTAPVVLVNHALTGNSQVTGENGWWNNVVGNVISLDKYSVVAFNIPGNGFRTNFLIDNYKDWTIYKVAELFWEALSQLKVNCLYAIIGGSLGGAIGWEMLIQKPNAVQKMIPIATHWKANDWLIAQVYVQDLILNNSIKPIEDARAHAMLLYRTPQSLKSKFNGSKQFDNENLFQIESWLLHHGNKLKERFQLAAYKQMNHLLKTIYCADNLDDLKVKIKSSSTEIHVIGVDSDLFFVPQENKETVEKLKYTNSIYYHEINSIHGHDAFLIEYEQLEKIIKPLF